MLLQCRRDVLAWIDGVEQRRVVGGMPGSNRIDTGPAAPGAIVADLVAFGPRQVCQAALLDLQGQRVVSGRSSHLMRTSSSRGLNGLMM